MEATSRIVGVLGAHHGGRQQTVDAEPALLINVDLVPGQRLGTRFHTHTSSPAPTAARGCRRRVPGGIGTCDGLSPSPGNTFPGFMRRWGSKTRRTRSITSRSSSEKTYRMFSRFS